LTAHIEDGDQSASLWPALTDLFSATSLLFVTLVGVFVYITVAQQGITNTTRQRIMRQLAGASQKGTLYSIDSTDRQFVRIILKERATFPAGKFQWETLRPEGKIALQAIGRVLNDTALTSLYREVRVIGHSDQVPFVTGSFTNWELSASRAAVVARFLVNWVRVDPCKISATGRGPYLPVDSKNMESNRRIEIQILPRLERGEVSTMDRCDANGDGTRAYAAQAMKRFGWSDTSATSRIARPAVRPGSRSSAGDSSSNAVDTMIPSGPGR
jgi:outer membrane protein OmpA-like peptidoglycan-associated protein